MDALTRFRLTAPELGFWVEVRLRQVDGAWLAVADLAGTPELGLSSDRARARFVALWPLGPEVAARLASGASQGDESHRRRRVE